MATMLVTGMSGGLAHLVARKLLSAGHQVVGVDYRPVDEPLPPGVTFYQASYNKRSIEDVFRHHTFDSVLHLGRVSDLAQTAGKRFELNVVGSQKLMTLCRVYGVKSMLVLSTFHIYGAHPANHIPIDEDDPLRAAVRFPQITDAIQLDNLATTWIYRYPEVCTMVLRPTNVLGPHIKNTISTLLRSPSVVHLAGFNPMVQFIHEEDLADAILAAIAWPHPGVYNLAGATSIPLRDALRMARARTWPVPAPLVSAYLSATQDFPSYLINFFKYPCVISDRLFRDTFSWTPKMSLEESIWSTVVEARERQARADRP